MAGAAMSGMTARPAAWARLAAPFVVVWLAVHVVLLAMLALAWGLVIAAKVVLGWLAHTFVFIILLASGVTLALWLWKAARPRRLPRPA